MTNELNSVNKGGRPRSWEQIKLDGPKLKVPLKQQELISMTAFACGLSPTGFIRAAALDTAKRILWELYERQPAQFNKVLKCASDRLISSGLITQRLTVEQVIADLDYENIDPLIRALEQTGISITEDVCNG